MLCGYFDHQRRVQFEGCVTGPLKTMSAILAGSNWSCALLRIVLQDALSEVTKIYPPQKLRFFVDDITALLLGKTKKRLKWQRSDEEVERRSRKNGLTLLVGEKGKGWKEQDARVVWFLGGRAASMQQRRRSDDGRQCGNAWSGFENKSQELGSERKSKEKEVQSEILTQKEEQGLPAELHEDGGQEATTSGMVPARTWWVHAVEMIPTERLKLRRE